MYALLKIYPRIPWDISQLCWRSSSRALTQQLGMANDSVAAALGQIPDDEAWHRTIILPRDILDNPPSGEHEVDWETESSHRIWGCELLQEAGILLRCALSGL